MKSTFTDLVRHDEDGLLVVGIDPGETTGVCAFQGARLLDADQIATRTIPKGVDAILTYIERRIEEAAPTRVVVALECYRIYPHKLKKHSGSSVYTLRLIGALEYVVARSGWACVQKMAGDVKGFCTDHKLRTWKLFQKKKRHANDAVRHACHFLLFGGKRNKSRQNTSKRLTEAPTSGHCR